MPFNGAGVFQRVRNWVADAAAGIKIRADFHDAEDDGFADGLSNCITKDGQTVVTQNIPWNSKRITGLADPVNGQDAATKAYADTKMTSTGGVSTGDLTISKGSPTFVLNSLDAGGSGLQGQKNGKMRWFMRLGNDAAETGGNAGSDFDLHRYGDDGGYLGQVLNINRGANSWQVSGAVTVNAEIISSPGGLNSFRQTSGGYGVFNHHNGPNWYLMVTNAGDPLGSFNGLRPMQLDIPTGNINFGHAVTVTGPLRAQGMAVYGGIPAAQIGHGHVAGAANAQMLLWGSVPGGQTVTIDGAQFPVGSVISFMGWQGPMTIANTESMSWLNASGVSAAGTRVLQHTGVATAVKFAGGYWVISGNGLS